MQNIESERRKMINVDIIGRNILKKIEYIKKMQKGIINDAYKKTINFG